ncbi:CsbD family protein [Vagococcus sp. PNs007]|uniref:CsbD family protein n=1 Tax=Vagococcus proximus TaxID=2991417 RepID=A0ABT5X2W1_9ENTE|nr:CsbD family protein [Vagococcus proximus]MDF0480353.1 CsbD family protein [Vagococcus proximus]
MVNKDELLGKAKEGIGKVTDDGSKELEGKLQEGLGKLKEKGEELVDDISHKVNDTIDHVKHSDKEE